jgi:DNA-binding response OmpR family regulator
MNGRVLVVEDHEPTARLVQDVLERDGLAVVLAGDGAAALRHLRDEQPDLLILDRMLPDADGLGILRELRRQPGTLYLPVIVLTGRKSHGDVLDGWMGGASLYLTKPFAIGQLVDAVHKLLRSPARQQPAPRGEDPSDEPTDGSPGPRDRVLSGTPR